jgi:hypothetical protein
MKAKSDSKRRETRRKSMKKAGKNPEVKPRLIKRFHFSTKKQGSMQPALITEL